MVEHYPNLSEKEPVRAVVLAAGSAKLPNAEHPLLLRRGVISTERLREIVPDLEDLS